MKSFKCVLLSGIAVALLPAMADLSHGQGRQLREHTVVQSSGDPTLEPANQEAPAASDVTVSVDGNERIIEANGMPGTLVGQFPNRGNPHAMAIQNIVYRVSSEPKLAEQTTPVDLGEFGVAVNGVPFEPAAAEWYLGNPGGGWRYEPLSGALRLGMDANYAHVQAQGNYHYHGLPTLLLEGLGVSESAHSPLVGWAGDGFPIYALYGNSKGDDPSSAIKELTSSYRLKPNGRPTGNLEPGGTYDGTFVIDYEYVAGAGDLDECNGRFSVTPEFPQGTYAYFLSEAWPVIPRCFRGTPAAQFVRPRLQD